MISATVSYLLCNRKGNQHFTTWDVIVNERFTYRLRKAEHEGQYRVTLHDYDTHDVLAEWVTPQAPSLDAVRRWMEGQLNG